jgi:hypothetical protein
MRMKRLRRGVLIVGMIFIGCAETPAPDPATDIRPHGMATVHEENQLREVVFEAVLKQSVPDDAASLFLRSKQVVSVCAVVVTPKEDPLGPVEHRAVYFAEPERRAVLGAEPLGLALTKIAERRGLLYSCPASGKQEQHTDVFIGAVWQWPGDDEVEVQVQMRRRERWFHQPLCPEVLVCSAEPVGGRWVAGRCENEYSDCRRARACS